jgi:hypothetical protein
MMEFSFRIERTTSLSESNIAGPLSRVFKAGFGPPFHPAFMRRPALHEDYGS